MKNEMGFPLDDFIRISESTQEKEIVRLYTPKSKDGKISSITLHVPIMFVHITRFASCHTCWI